MTRPLITRLFPPVSLRPATRLRWGLYVLAAILLASYGRAWYLASRVTYDRMPGLGELAPTTLPLLDAHTGQTVTLARWLGQGPVYVEFWATLCGVSQQELPELARWATPRPEVPVVIIATDPPAVIRATLEAWGVAFPNALIVLSDPTQQTFHAFGVEGTPTAFILDAQGRVGFSRIGGPDRTDNFDGQLLRVQTDPPASHP